MWRFHSEGFKNLQHYLTPLYVIADSTSVGFCMANRISDKRLKTVEDAFILLSFDGRFRIRASCHFPSARKGHGYVINDESKDSSLAVLHRKRLSWIAGAVPKDASGSSPSMLAHPSRALSHQSLFRTPARRPL